MPIPESDWAKLTPGGSAPVTMASAATIAPVSYLTILTGNTAIANITPPVPGPHSLVLLFAGTAGVAATGNILTAVASVVGVGMQLVYNADAKKYVPLG